MPDEKQDQTGAVETGEYKESDEHVPDPTDLSGTLDTSGTAGAAHNNLRNVTPVFDVASQQEAIAAARALDPEDDGVPESAVVLPTGTQVVSGDPVAARDRIKAKARTAKQNPVKVEDPAPSDAAAKSDDPEFKRQETVRQQREDNEAVSGSSANRSKR